MIGDILQGIVDAVIKISEQMFNSRVHIYLGIALIIIVLLFFLGKL